MLLAIRVEFLAPAFSIKRSLSYQISDALILPQPSTLFSSLICVLSKANYIIAEGIGEDYLKNLARILRGKILRITVKPLSPVILTPVTLSRLRTLEKTSNEVIEEINENKKISNPMLREYANGKFAAYFLFKEEELYKKSLKALPLISRLGDTESLVNVIAVEEAKIQFINNEEQLDTYTNVEYINEAEGNFILIRLCTEDYVEDFLGKIPIKDLRKLTTEKLNLFNKHCKFFYLPFEIMKTSKDFILYKPSLYKVKTKENYLIASFKTSSDEARIVINKEWVK